MRRIFSPLTVALLALLATPAAAQMYPGEDVSVNPAAIPPPLPSNPGFTLHRPGLHRHVHHRVATASSGSVAPPAPVDTVATMTGPTATPAPQKPATQTKKTAQAAPPSSTEQEGQAFSFGEDQPPPPSAPAQKTASREVPQAHTPTKSAESDIGTKRGEITFEHDATSPEPDKMNGIKLLAGDLNQALEAGATEIELIAFGGPPGDKSSDARRIALKRALAIRQILIDNGVSASRIVTKAMGGATDNGQPDRVDIYVRSG